MEYTLNPDGSANVQIAGRKAVGPTLIATIPFTDAGIVVSSTTYKRYNTKLDKSATQRTFSIVNMLNIALTNVALNLFDNSISQGASSQVGNSAQITASLSAGGQGTDSSEFHPSLATHADSFQMSFGVGTTLPTSGNVYVYVTEVY